MGVRLVGEVAAWLESPAAAELTQSERLVLLLIAERAKDTTRRMLSFRGDRRDDGTKITLTELLQARTGLTERGLSDTVQRLSKRGLEVRVPVGKDKNGVIMFARRGHATDYILPELPASVSLPEPPPRRGSHRS
ncbi:hypothetical protein [Nonomuraea wenchangensis]|uniref:Uncharacterized protein n=1 Tax=Nonomuraea wenchangensis TaxID=568860 RepID=A0A1I0LTZ8_9ACTN|nr:hypothetical protein [Nonomuraea wenchangensis]SEU46463.1 hypothetical protein SAMN05421811_12740 [Nonomuraea wenchangensis]